MDEKRTYPPNAILCRDGESPSEAYQVVTGKVRLTRRLGEIEVPISMLGPGDVIAAEVLFDDQPLSYTAHAVGELECLVLTRPEFESVRTGVPEWMDTWIHDYINSQRIKERPERSNVATLYSVCNLLYAFMKMVDTGESEGLLKGPMKPVTEEIRKSKTISRPLILPILKGLSAVGLIDLREGDPLYPVILLSDLQLYLGFLVFLQNVADLKVGLHESVFVLNPMRFSKEAEKLLDSLLTDEELADRIFEPERAMVHLSIERLQEIYRSFGGEEDLAPNHGGLKELEGHGVFTRIRDNERLSVFLNLRNLLRLNIRRDPIANYVDILDYLLDTMYEARFAYENSGTHPRMV